MKNTPQHAGKDPAAPLDLVFVTNVDHLYTLSLSLESLLRFHTFESVHVITSRKSFKFFNHLANLCGTTNFNLLDEDEVLPGMTLNQLAQCDKPCFPKRAGWYFQQFLKLGASNLDFVSENYVVVDADTIFLKDTPFLGTDGKFLFTISSEFHAPYFSNYNIIMNEDARREFSFISQYMVFNKSIVKSMIRHIQSNLGADKDWYWLIIENIKGQDASLFSEYETYGHYMKNHYPDLCTYLDVQWLRLESYSICSYFPSRKSISCLPGQYNYVSYEQRSSTLGGKIAKRICKYVAPYVLMSMNIASGK
jgi:Family of unknown function (DUF6492)